MDADEKDTLIRAYANSEVSWRSLQDRGFSNYLEVLAGLGEVGLRPPPAEMTGPNVESRQRGVALLRAKIREQTNRSRIIITDTSPLITLGITDQLSVLLLARIPIEIPDAVYNEATRVPTRPDVVQISDWINTNSKMLRIAPTDIGIDQIRRLEDHRPTCGMGERAAFETLNIVLGLHPQDKAILLFEDMDILEHWVPFQDEQTELISTGDFLRVFEQEQVILSVEALLQKAAAVGKSITKKREQ